MKKVLIVGNLGYVGPVVVQSLAVHHEVYGYDIGYFSGHETTRVMLPETTLKAQYYGDVRNFPYHLLDGMDAVVYLAAISNDPMGNAFERPTMEINCAAAVKIAREARQRGVSSFVFASSCSVYGLADSNPRTEKSEVNPLTAYARSKVQGEKGLAPLAADQFRITCLRFATACGFSPRLRLDLVLNDFVACAVTTGKIEILSDGKPWRPLIDVKDMAQAISWAIDREDHEPFLVVNTGSDDWNFQVIDLANAVKRIIPGVEVMVNPKALPDNRSYKVDFGLYRKLAPDHYPKAAVDGTIRRLHEGLQNIGFKNSDFRNSTLIRLKVLNQLLAEGVLNNELQPVKSNR